MARIIDGVPTLERLEEHLGELLGIEPLSPATLTGHLLAGQLVAVGIAVEIELVGPLAVDELVLLAPQREVDLEDGLERPPVRMVLDQRGAERILERLTVLEGHVHHGLHGVEVLGQAHRQTRHCGARR